MRGAGEGAGAAVAHAYGRLAGIVDATASSVKRAGVSSESTSAARPCEMWGVPAHVRSPSRHMYCTACTADGGPAAAYAGATGPGAHACCRPCRQMSCTQRDCKGATAEGRCRYITSLAAIMTGHDGKAEVRCGRALVTMAEHSGHAACRRQVGGPNAVECCERERAENVGGDAGGADAASDQTGINTITCSETHSCSRALCAQRLPLAALL